MSVTRPWPGNRSRPRFVVAPRVFRASEGPATVCAGGRRPAREPSAPCVVACGSAGVPGVVGPGRPRDRHTRACGSEWSISKPARALRTLRRPPRQWGRVAMNSPARPRHRPPAPRQIPSAPSTPVGLGVLTCGWVRVVTNVVNPSAFSLKMLVFGLRLTTFVTEVLARRFKSCWFDAVCNVGRPLVARPGSAAAHGHRSLALRSLRLPPHRRRCVAGVWLGACCYKRRQSKVFFVWISDPLLQTSSI